ncbi:MAG: hypothetical protein ABH828_05690 [archaeon]
MKSILSLSKYVKMLPKKKREVFLRLYSVSEDYGELKIPKEMKPWVEKTFGSVKGVEKHKIIRTDNNITSESSLFNELRTKRPLDSNNNNNNTNINKIIKEHENGPFCKPLTGTPEDTFGRIKGKYSITSSNVAKYDALHGLIIFKEHNPLKFTSENIKDYLTTAQKWINKAHKANPEKNFPYIMWNCLWKAGSSIVHGHFQLLLGKNKHYGDIERLRRFASGYSIVFNSDYFNDFYHAHESIGLGFEKKNSKIIAHLTPKKEKEVIIISMRLNDVSEALYRVLKAYRKMGVESFNMGIYLQPLDKSWEMPVITRIVDRGSLSNNVVDIGGMEMFAGTSIIGSDPYKVIEKVKKEF